MFDLRRTGPRGPRAWGHLERNYSSISETDPHFGTIRTMSAVWRRLTQIVQAQDLAWLVLFTALGAVSPSLSNIEIALLSCLAFLQVVERRIPRSRHPEGRCSPSR